MTIAADSADRPWSTPERCSDCNQAIRWVSLGQPSGTPQQASERLIGTCACPSKARLVVRGR